jgi:hypothetical protein
MDWMVKLLLVAVKNAIYFLGAESLNGMIEPPMTRALNYYQIPFELEHIFAGQEGYAEFNLDFRHIDDDPDIGTGYAEFLLIGDWLYEGKSCQNSIVDNNIHFFDSVDYSQLVVGESAMTCIFNQISKSPIGKISLNTKKFNQLFKVEDYSLNTTSIASHIKIFERVAGRNKPMTADLSFEQIKISFGKGPADAVMEYEMCIRFGLDDATKTELLYDCQHIVTAATVSADNDIFHLNLLEHRVSMEGNIVNREAPHRNSMNMTSTDYQEFLEDFSFSVSEFKQWANDVVLRGNRVKFPYTFDQFQTFLRFEEQKMHIMLDIEDNAYQFLESRMWKDWKGMMSNYEKTE